jgi:hypothetical protein
MGKDVESNSSGIIYDIIPVCASGTEENHENQK